TCSAMVETFARDGWQEINRLWEQKELSTEECANKTFELFDAVPDDIKKLMKSIEIDDYFIAFLKLCKRQEDKVYILSDGYDLNIQTILKKYNIDVPYFCNRLIYTDKFMIQCPHINQSCGKCGTCKTTLMKQLKEPGSQTIYIGDGYSDTCPATHADIVYAKGSLYAFCMENGIDAIPYQSFKDIIG
ncbi:MAG: MtnX-like HAD-IB family phosphatase, partial [Bacillota bacterium]|nr:MtnX-like HAD-IB family phosphatase [Bacillota bacterium]